MFAGLAQRVAKVKGHVLFVCFRRSDSVDVQVYQENSFSHSVAEINSGTH